MRQDESNDHTSVETDWDHGQTVKEAVAVFLFPIRGFSCKLDSETLLLEINLGPCCVSAGSKMYALTCSISHPEITLEFLTYEWHDQYISRVSTYMNTKQTVIALSRSFSFVIWQKLSSANRQD